MPYASEAQRRYFHAAESRGDMPRSVVHEFDRASKGKRLPKRARKATKRKRLAEALKHQKS